MINMKNMNIGYGEYVLLKYSPVFKRRYTADGDLKLGCTIGCKFCYYRMIDATAPYIGTGKLKDLASPEMFAEFVKNSKIIAPGDLVILGARGDASMYEPLVPRVAERLKDYNILALRRAPFTPAVFDQLEKHSNLYYGTTITPLARKTGTPVSEDSQLAALKRGVETHGRGIVRRISVEVGPIAPYNASAVPRILESLADMGFQSFIYRGVSVGAWGFPLEKVIDKLGGFAYIKPREKKEYFYALKNFLTGELEQMVKGLATELSLRAYRHTGIFYHTEWRIPVALNRRNKVRRDVYEAARGGDATSAGIRKSLEEMGYTVTDVDEVDKRVFKVYTREPVTEDVAMAVGAWYGAAVLAENYMVSPDLKMLKMYIENSLFAVMHGYHYRDIIREVGRCEADNNSMERTPALQ